ncbi:MAG: CPBP family intramembrane metalloprotease [Porphyromonas sp.]|nr:CPBP family intramembrane metalloprotease [Porphyromonas sp.]
MIPQNSTQQNPGINPDEQLPIRQEEILYTPYPPTPYPKNKNLAPVWVALVSLVGVYLVLAFLLAPLMVGLDFIQIEPFTESLLTNIIVAIVTFLLPAIILNHLHFKGYRNRIFTVKHEQRKGMLWIVIAATAVTIIISTLLAQAVEKIPIPETLEPLQEFLSKAREMINQMASSSKNSPFAIDHIMFFVIIVVLAPVGEELFFRGMLQGYLYKKTGRVHMAVWITAIIFSIGHLEYVGFLSRTILGAVAGYAAVYGSLRLAILVHALNNFSAWVAIYILPEEFTFSPLPESPALYYSLLVVVAIILMYPLYRIIGRMQRIFHDSCISGKERVHL